MKMTVGLAGILVICLCGPAAHGSPWFIDVGDLPGGEDSASAMAISGDGQVVVGHSVSASSGSNNEAFRWTQAVGMAGLGDLPGGDFASYAYGVSDDGSAVVGASRSGNSSQSYYGEAFRWTASAGMVGLGDLPGGEFWSQANDASADGSVVVGRGSVDISLGFTRAFRWTESGGMQDLGTLESGWTSVAQGVSADGSIVVGSSSSYPDEEAFLWTEAGGMVGLGNLGGGNQSAAYAVSPDGTVVVGQALSPAGNEAFTWTAAGGMAGLGDLPGGSYMSQATDVSADGSIIVGNATTDTGGEAFIWDSVNGMRNLKDVLVDEYGLDLSGWQLTNAKGISDDGLTIVGSGIDPAGLGAGWVAHIPEPGSLSLLGLGALVLLRRRRRD